MKRIVLAGVFVLMSVLVVFGGVKKPKKQTTRDKRQTTTTRVTPTKPAARTTTTTRTNQSTAKSTTSTRSTTASSTQNKKPTDNGKSAPAVKLPVANVKVETLANGIETFKLPVDGWGLYFVGNPEKDPESGEVAPVKLSCPNNEFSGKISGPELHFPVEESGRWGKFIFERTGWWISGCLWTEKRKGIGSFTSPDKGPSGNDFGSLWVRRAFTVPREWEGRMVSMNFGTMTDGAAVVFINRKRIGYVRGPVDTLVVSPALKYGADNEILIFLTCKGWSIPENMEGVAAKEFKPKAAIGALNFDGDAPRLTASPKVLVTDVFANTSWRKHTLTPEIELLSERAQKVAVQCIVKDKDGKEVFCNRTSHDVQGGVSKIAPVIPWANPITWEIGRGYLYTMEITVVGEDRKKSAFTPFKFGFREVWRDGKNIYMNGHRQSFRTVYHHHNNGPYGADFLRQVGYNTIHYSHQLQKNPILDYKYLRTLSEMGIAYVAPAPNIIFPEQGAFIKDPTRLEAFGILMDANIRKTRNEPCVVMYYTGVNNCVPNWEQRPDWLAVGDGSNVMDRTKLAQKVAALGHRYNPNTLFFSHGDGNWAGDVSSHNLYLNFIPFHERENFWWNWSIRGTHPWQGSEFGQPYERSWDHGPGFPAVPEFLAEYYGDEAIVKTPALQKAINFCNGYPNYPLGAHPVFWDYTSNIVWRTNRAYRSDGGQGGLVWFNLEGFGNWGDTVYEDHLRHAVSKEQWNAGAPLRSFKDYVTGNPKWLWPGYYAYQLGNKDFLGFIGGWPRFTNRVHDYFPGDTVEKQICMMWDMFDTRSFSCEWKAELGGNKLAGGKVEKKLECNVFTSEKISFQAPTVAKRTAGKISAVFRDASGVEVFRDTVDFEVTPRPAVIPAGTFPNFVIFDPMMELKSWLDDLGVKNYRTVNKLSQVTAADKFLIIGKSAIKFNEFTLNPSLVRKGLKVMFLFQPKDISEDMGFNTEGRQSRDLFLRDPFSPALASLEQTDLSYWRGCPMLQEGNLWEDTHEFGGLGGEGPKWIRDSALACLLYRTPNIVGFRPEIAGAFNLEYSALMNFFDGKGKITYCAFQFEERMKNDPGARRTAEAVLRHFFLEDNDISADRQVCALGNSAAALLRMIGYQGIEPLASPAKIPARAVVVVGPDARVTAQDLASALANGASVVSYCNKQLETGFGVSRSGTPKGQKDIDTWFEAHPEEKGLSLRSKRFNEEVTSKLPYSVEPSLNDPVTRAIGREILHWQLFQEIVPYAKPARGRLLMGGHLAVIDHKAGGTVVCAQFDPTLSYRRFMPWAIEYAPVAEGWKKGEAPDSSTEEGKKKEGGAKWLAGHTRPDRIRIPTIYARILTNLGAAPDPRALGRQFVFKKAEHCVKPSNYSELIDYSGFYVPNESYGRIYRFQYW